MAVKNTLYGGADMNNERAADFDFNDTINETLLFTNSLTQVASESSASISANGSSVPLNYAGSGVLQSVHCAVQGDTQFGAGEIKFYIRIDSDWPISGAGPIVEPTSSTASIASSCWNFNRYFYSGCEVVIKNSDGSNSHTAGAALSYQHW